MLAQSGAIPADMNETSNAFPTRGALMYPGAAGEDVTVI